MVRFDETKIDDILDDKIKNSTIPKNAEILSIGVGRIFEEKYVEKYKLNL